MLKQWEQRACKWDGNCRKIQKIQDAKRKTGISVRKITLAYPYNVLDNWNQRRDKKYIKFQNLSNFYCSDISLTHFPLIN